MPESPFFKDPQRDRLKMGWVGAQRADVMAQSVAHDGMDLGELVVYVLCCLHKGSTRQTNSMMV